MMMSFSMSQGVCHLGSGKSKTAEKGFWNGFLYLGSMLQNRRGLGYMEEGWGAAVGSFRLDG